jgi:hypothetical protein
VIARIAGPARRDPHDAAELDRAALDRRENLNYPQGPEYMARLAREAGFQRVEIVPTAGKAGVFATLDAGARTTLAIYFMYDVKQYDPAEWSSPPLEGGWWTGRAWAR